MDYLRSAAALRAQAEKLELRGARVDALEEALDCVVHSGVIQFDTGEGRTYCYAAVKFVWGGDAGRWAVTGMDNSYRTNRQMAEWLVDHEVDDIWVAQDWEPASALVEDES